MKQLSRNISKLIVAFLATSLFGLAAPAQGAPQSGDLTVKIHYQRGDGNYTNWSYWIWLKDGSGTITKPDNSTVSSAGGWVAANVSGTDSFGAVASLTIKGASNVSQVGFVVNSGASWSGTVKNGGDRFIDLTGTTTEVWTGDVDTSIKTSAPSAPKVTIHYKRADATYTNWHAYVWIKAGSGTGTIGGSGVTKATSVANTPQGYWVPVNNVGSDSYGAIGEFQINDAVNVTSIGLIMNSGASWSGTAKDPASATDRFITVSGNNTEVWTESTTGAQILTTNPNPTATATATTTATATPTASPLSGNLTITMHYNRQAGDYAGRFAWVWLKDTNASGAIGGTSVIPASGGAWVPVDNAGVDSYGGVSTFTITGATNVANIGVIQLSTNNWTSGVRDTASANDRSFAVQGSETTVWLQADVATISATDPLSPSDALTQTVTVHYSRADGNYAGWNLHMGTQSKVMDAKKWVSPTTYSFTDTNPTGYTVGKDKFGAYIRVALPYYAAQTNFLNMIVYTPGQGGAWNKDGGDAEGTRYFATSTSGTTNVWLVSGQAGALGADPGNIGGTPDPVPFIETIDPVSGTAGDQVTVTGTNLKIGSTDPTVMVGASSAFVFASTETSVTFIVPTGLDAAPTTVTVSTAGGYSNQIGFTVSGSSSTGGPVIDSFSPDSARRGDSVTINGSGFAGATLSIDTIPGTLEATVTDTSIGFTIPAGIMLGSHIVTVTTELGVTAANYVVLPDAPVITSITDVDGNPLTSGKQGDIVVINGSNFFDTWKVEFAGQSADIYSLDAIIKDTSITVAIPETVTGVITVTTPGGTGSSEVFNITGVPAPVIESVSVTEARGGDAITLTGSSLLGATITVGGVTAEQFGMAMPSAVNFTMPFGVTPGSATIQLTTDSGTTTAALTVLPDVPVITGFSVPNAYEGDTITISGTGFAGATDVSFNGVAADLTNPAFVVSEDGTSITVVVPSGATTGPVTVTTVNGTGTSESFTIGDLTPTETPSPTDSPTVEPTVEPTDTPTPEPTDPPVGGVVIDSIIPTAVMPGDVVEVFGSMFGNNPTVQVGETAAEVLDFTDSSVLFIVPETTSFGDVTVTVTWDDASTGSTNLTVIAGIPTISSLSELSGKAGDVLTISGSNFYGVTAVTFNGDGSADSVPADLAAEGYSVAPDGSSVTVVVPEGVTTGTISVTTDGGTADSAELTDETGIYTIVAPPTIDSLSASSGKFGDVIEITGTNLDTTTAVDFNGTAADLTDANVLIDESGTRVVVVVPDGATSGPITITTPGGSATSEPFTIVAPPTIESLSATSGKVGSTLVITGTNFGGTTEVVFEGDGTADPVLADITTATITDTEITVVIPEGATSGVITVSTPGGSATSEDSFEILMPPTVSSLSVTSAKVGAVIQIRGTNLEGVSVRIRGVLATIGAGSTDKVLNVTVPAVALGATKVAVTKTGFDPIQVNFTVLTSAPIIKSFTQSTSKKRGVGTVTVIGQNLLGATVKVGTLRATVRPGASDTRLVFILPGKAIATAKGSFSVTTGSGTAKSKSTLKVTVK